MISTARYTTLKLSPYTNRSEHVNYGLLVFEMIKGQVFLEAHFAPVSRKISGFAPHISFADLRANAQALAQAVNNEGFETFDAALSWLNALNFLPERAMQSFGAIKFRDFSERQTRINWALMNLCGTPSAKGGPREPKSRLFRDVKAQFKAIGILAPIGADLPDHQVIANYAPEPDSDVKVEFALQNGHMRIAQTIDLRSTNSEELTSHQRQSVLSKAFSLHYATQVIGERTNSLETWMICAGANDRKAERLINALDKQAQNLVHWESALEMNEFMESWSRAAGRELPRMPLN